MCGKNNNTANNWKVILIFLLVFSGRVSSQFYSRGEEPSYLKWRQINTDHFNVIYPEEISKEAKRMTHILEFYYEQNSSYLDNQPKKIPVILHNHSVYSNGFVAWAPKRIELVTTPSSNQHSQDHFEQLALHEFRHVVQVDKLDQGLTRFLKLIFGEQAQGAVAGLMPFWLLEGNAVDAETRLSNSGRGRLPGFEKEIKAILLEKEKIYPYEKSYYGSFKDFVPSYYEYGYQMVAHGRNKYGEDLWENMVEYIARKPYLLYPSFFGLKKYTGLSRSMLYEETINTLKAHWTEQASSRVVSDYRRINKRPLKHYTSYCFPDYINDTLIFAEKSGIDQIEEFVLIDNKGKEKVIHVPGFYKPANISVAQNLIVWAEQISDARWARESYSLIKSYDILTGKEKLLTVNSRYFAPEFSRDAQWIVVAEISELNECALVILEANTGKVIQRIPSPGNEYLQYPVWSGEESIIVTSMGDDGKKIKKYNLKNKLWETLFHAGFEDIAELSSAQDYVLFRGTFSGIDNIYALDLKTGKCYMITSSEFGAYYPQLSTNGKKFIYSNYTSQGFDIVETDFEEALRIPVDSVIDHREQLYRPDEEEEKLVQKPQSVTIPDYTEENYHKLTNLFKFHSWAPFYFDYENPDIENPDVSLGISLISQNLLSTAFTTISYEYNLDQRDHFIHTSFVYKGLYPIFRFRYDFGGLPFVAEPPDISQKLEKVKTNVSWRMKVYLPLDITSNKYVRGIQPSIETCYERSYLWDENKNEYHAGSTLFDYRFYACNYLKRSGRDILPGWGQVVDFRFIHAPWSADNIGTEFAAQGIIYLPGFFRHHTLKINGGYLKQNIKKYVLNNLVNMPRGYETYRSEQFLKLTADYVFPIIYPDLRIWHLLYIKRIKASLFYDYGFGKNVFISGNNGTVKEDRFFRSFGVELTSDFHFMQILFPFDAGIRYNYLTDESKSKVEFIFSIDLSRF